MNSPHAAPHAPKTRTRTGLSTVAQRELHQHTADVRLDRLLGDDQVGGDLDVGHAAGDEGQHLGLAVGQAVEVLAAGGLGRPRRATIAASLYWLVAAVLIGAYFTYSAVAEGRFMASRFPESYPGYKRSTKMLIPFVF